MLEPLRQVGQWAWLQASSKAAPLDGASVGVPSSYASSDHWIPQGQAKGSYSNPYYETSGDVVEPVPESPQGSVLESAPEAVQSKALKPPGTQRVTFQALWPEGTKQLARLKRQISQPLSQSAWAQGILKHSPFQPKPMSSKPASPSENPTPVSNAQATWNKLGEKLGLKKPPPKLPERPSSGFRPREEVLKGFPYRDLNKIPRFSLKPEQIAWNPNAEANWRIESEVYNAPWDSQHLFNPFLGE